MATMENDFVSWLYSEMEGRGWSISELARRAGVSHVAISNILNHKRNIGIDVCSGIAHAFRDSYSYTEVFRLAGIFPPLPAAPDERLAQEIYEAVSRLTLAEREELLEYLGWLEFRREERIGEMTAASGTT
jgi:transcriptional regulator with XRE-family HTH domain